MRLIVAASSSLIIRGQSLSILVSSAVIAFASGVLSGVAMFVLAVLAGGFAQPNWKAATSISANNNVSKQKYLFITAALLHQTINLWSQESICFYSKSLDESILNPLSGRFS